MFFRSHTDITENKLDVSIVNAMNELKVIGVSAAFVKNDDVIWSKGYGWADIERCIRADSNTIYRLGSISKSITATALMQLYENGCFCLDDDISDYLGYKVRNPNYPDTKITFRMLCTHTSSILDGEAEREDEKPQGYALARQSDNPPLLKDLLVKNRGEFYSEQTWGIYEPGTKFVYSNLGGAIIACLVEKISMQHLSKYCEDNIFRPLGIDFTYSIKDVKDLDKVATLYRGTMEGKSIITTTYKDFLNAPYLGSKKQQIIGNGYILPSGGVRCNVVDLAKFMIMHMNGGTYKGIKILNKETVDLMHQINWFGDELYGLYRAKGLNINVTDKLAKRRLRGHSGSAYGLLGDMFFNSDEKVGVVFITNGKFSIDEKKFTDLETRVINAIFDYWAPVAQITEKRFEFKLGSTAGKVNDRMIEFFKPVQVIDGKICMPIMALSDALDAEILLDEDKHIIMLKKKDKEVYINAGNVSIDTHNNSVKVITDNFDKDHNVMIPIKEVAEYLGARVELLNDNIRIEFIS